MSEYFTVNDLIAELQKLPGSEPILSKARGSDHTRYTAINKAFKDDNGNNVITFDDSLLTQGNK